MERKRRRFITWFLVLAILFSQISFLDLNVARGAEAEKFLITGTGVKNDVLIYDWSSYKMIEKIYSTNNSLGFHKIVKVKGYDLFELIGGNNLKADQDYQVKFTCSDGFEFTKTVNELKNTFYYSDFTEGTKAQSLPMIARYTMVLADYPKNNFAPPVKWQDQGLTEKDLDKDFPKLVFGQTSIDDMNMSQWGKQVVKITIGDDRKENTTSLDQKSSYKHISYEGAPYNIDAITGATLTIEGPAVEGYRAISLRQIEEDTKGQMRDTYYESIEGKIVENSYEGIGVNYLIDNYVKAKPNAGNIVFKDKSRKVIMKRPIEDASKYMIAYGINEVPLVFLDSDVGYKNKKYNDNGCFKLVYKQEPLSAKEFSNVAYIYIEEKDAKNIYEHTYSPYNNPRFKDYEFVIHGDAMDQEVRYTVSDIENMKNLHIEEEYSLSNSEYFWYYNTYKGVRLWDLLLKAGIDPKIDEETKVQLVAADNYNFPPLTIKDIKNDSLYGYYEKSPYDKGDGTFNGKDVEPLHTGSPVLVAYGFNGYPYVIRPTDEGYNPGLGNDGGPIRIIFGKTDYQHTNGSLQVQYAKEIIIGEGKPITTSDSGTGMGENTQIGVDENSAWNHNQGVYKQYLDMPVLRVTGSQVKEPMTFTLGQIEALTQHAVRDTYSGDGVHQFEGVVLWDLINEVVGLKDGVEVPSIRVFSGQNYNQILRSNEQVINGVFNSQGQNKDIILAYAINGYPLVANEGDIGYSNNNAYGPLRLIIEENKSMWVKWMDCIVVGSGEYEKPEMKDVKDSLVDEKSGEKIWITYQNNTGKELVEASVRFMEYDREGNLWVSTNNGGIDVRSEEGKWTHYNEIETKNMGLLKVDTSYAMVQRENGEFWLALGGAESPQGILVKKDQSWTILNTDNSLIPSNFVQELELDGNGGLWIGTGYGVVSVDKNDQWTVYTKEDGLALSSVDAIEPDGFGGAWIGFYPEIEGEGESTTYLGAYQHIDKDGKITSYDGFDPKNFNLNWVRSISMDKDGGVWITRSGNAPGFTQGVVDYIKDGTTKTYTAKEIYPNINENDDIRFVMADKNEEGKLYIATKASGALISSGVGNIVEMINATNQFSSKQWNNVYFIDMEGDHFFIGTNGGAAVYSEAKSFYDVKNHWAKREIENMATKAFMNGHNGYYRPEDNISRAEFASLIVRVLGLESSSSTKLPFSDIKEDAWYEKNIAAAFENGIIKGYDDTTFRPNSKITREEIGWIISSKLEEGQVLSDIIMGFPDGSFGEKQYATRAQAAVILQRFLENER